jgi:hypothetical protein
MLKRIGDLFMDDGYTNVLDLDWNILVMLDCCRFDTFYFNYRDFLKGSLEKIIVPSIGTDEWLFNCIDRRFDDVVLVAGNPYLSNIRLRSLIGFDPFFRVVPVWDVHWNSYIETVHPRSIVNVFKREFIKYPFKRFILWFMQPHFPCIGKYDLKNWKDVRVGLFNKFFKSFNPDYAKMSYIENLRLVLSYCRELVDPVYGRVVISSDHGELLGEGNRFSHGSHFYGMRNLYNKSFSRYLFEVPLFEVDNEFV